MYHAAALSDAAGRKLEKLLDPHYPLCKDDVIWLLEYIKKKVAEEDPELLDLPQPRLLQNFRYFAEIAMLLIHRHPVYDQDTDRLKKWAAEAAYGLTGTAPVQSKRNS
jgi:hypothetical protein